MPTPTPIQSQYIAKLISLISIAGTDNSAPRTVAASVLSPTKSWATLLAEKIPPQYACGVRRWLIHMPCGNISGELYQFTAQEQARTAGYTYLSDGLGVQLEAYLSAYPDIEIIVYVGQMVNDHILNGLTGTARHDKAQENIQEYIDAGASIAIDDIDTGVTQGDWIEQFVLEQIANGVTVYVEPRIPSSKASNLKSLSSATVAHLFEEYPLTYDPITEPPGDHILLLTGSIPPSFGTFVTPPPSIGLQYNNAIAPWCKRSFANNKVPCFFFNYELLSLGTTGIVDYLITCVPDAPGAFTLQTPTNGATGVTTTPTFAWTASTTAGQYTIRVDDSSNMGSPIYSVTGPSSVTAFTIPPGYLSPGTTYYWTVSALADDTLDLQSTTGSPEPSMFRTLFASPGSFSLSAPANGATGTTQTPDLQWNTSSGALWYVVKVDDSSNMGSPIYSASITSPTHSAIVPAGYLQPGLTYYWNVYAVGVDGLTTMASPNPASFRVLAVGPSAFALTSPTHGSTGATTTPTLQWQSATGAIQYTINVDDSSNMGSPIYSVTGPSTSTSVTIPDSYLSRGVTYYWNVIAQGNDNQSTTGSPNPSTFRTLAYPPGSFSLTAPTNGVTGVSVTPTLRWTPSLSSSQYSVVVDNTTDLLSPVYTLTITSGATFAAIPVGYLQPGTTYYWNVTSLGDDGLTTTSTPTLASFRTLSLTAAEFYLSVPSDGATGVTTTPTFAWTDSQGATQYTLKVDNSSDMATPVYTVNGIAGVTSFTIPTGYLQPGTTYFWSVHAINDELASTTGSPYPAVFRTKVDPIGNFALVSPTNNSVGVTTTPTFEWSSSTGANQYLLKVDDSSNMASPLYTLTVGTTGATMPSGYLAEGVTYYWNVTAYDTLDWQSVVASPNPAAFRTLSPIAGTFDIVSPTNGQTLVSVTPTITWTTSTDADYYSLRIKTSPSTTANVYSATITAGTTGSTIPSGYLSPGTTYYCLLSALNGVDLRSIDANQSPVQFRTAAVGPTAFSLLSPVNGLTHITSTPLLMWSPSTLVSYYSIRVDNSSDMGSPVYSVTGPSNSTQVSVPAGYLNAGITYYWNVSAVSVPTVDGVLTVTASPNPAVFRVAATAPGAFTLKIPEDGSTGVTTSALLRWGDSSNAVQYTIKVDENFDMSTPVYTATAAAGVTGLTIPYGYLQPGTTYYWNVYASEFVDNQTQYGSPNPAIFQTIGSLTFGGTGPDAFSLVTPADGATNISPTVRLIWGAASGADEYEVRINSTNDFNDQNRSPNFALDYSITTSNPYYDVPNGMLEEDGTYYWSIIARNRFGSVVSSPTGASFTVAVEFVEESAGRSIQQTSIEESIVMVENETQPIGKLSRQIQNDNYLRINSFQFTIQKLEEMKYTCQSVNVPGIASEVVNQPTSINTVHWDGSEINYDELNVTFIVDEDMRNWIAIHDWIRSNAGSINSDEFESERTRRFSDATLTMLTNKNNTNIRILFHNCIPKSLSGLSLETTNQNSDSIVSTVVFAYDKYEIEVVDV